LVCALWKFCKLIGKFAFSVSAPAPAGNSVNVVKQVGVAVTVSGVRVGVDVGEVLDGVAVAVGITVLDGVAVGRGVKVTLGVAVLNGVAVVVAVGVNPTQIPVP